jgi:hypothetical protein
MTGNQIEKSNVNSKLSHQAETESLIDTIIRASKAGSPRTQTTDQAMRERKRYKALKLGKKTKENT